MSNINAFWSVVHEKKIFEDLSIFFLFCPFFGPKSGQPLYLNDLNPQASFLPSLVEAGLVVLEKKSYYFSKILSYKDGLVHYNLTLDDFVVFV